MALSFDTFTHYRSHRRVINHLSSVRSHFDQNQPLDDDDYNPQSNNNNNEPMESLPQAEARELQSKLHSLAETESHLRSTLHEYTSHTIPKIQSELRGLEHQIEVATRENTSHQSQLDTLRVQHQQRTEEIDNLKRKFEETHQVDGQMVIQSGEDKIAVDVKTLEELEDYVKEREGALWTKIDGLIERLKSQSHTEVVQWFGKGPHKVEIEIEYPQQVDNIEDSNNWPRVRGVFLIELAPLELMPVAINMFLQQIHHKLWIDCSMVINAFHILQAGPHGFEENKYVANKVELKEKFQEAKLDKMPFQEYHEDYPHEPWTIGFAGRPAGPDFYINKINNSKNHGPGGQKTHDLHEEADPCFGKIIKGQEILEEINKIPIDYDKGYVLKQHVRIVDTRIISGERDPLTEPVHDDDYHKDHLAEDPDAIAKREAEQRVREEEEAKAAQMREEAQIRQRQEEEARRQQEEQARLEREREEQARLEQEREEQTRLEREREEQARIEREREEQQHGAGPGPTQV